MNKIILDLCGGTGAWSRPYAEAGYDVRIITLPQDVRHYNPPGHVHGILAAPPCTEFAASGARWWKTKSPFLLAEAISIADACIDIIDVCSPAWWCLENPIGRLRTLMGDRLGPLRLAFDPCDYGDPYTKRTLLWGNFTLPTKHRVEPEGYRKGQPNAWYSKVGGRSPRTKKYRSQTPPGFARAFFEANP